MNTAAQAADAMLGKKPVAEGSTRPLTSETETMLAVVWKGKQKVALERTPKPLITHPEDVIVKITSCSICSGSDSHVYCGEIPDTKTGQILGHEGMGVVAEVGKDVKKFKVGDRVVIAFDIACGRCDFCKRQEYTGCDSTNDSKLGQEMVGQVAGAIFGYGDMLGGVPGSQAEFVRVPFADVNCYPIPPEIPDKKALFMSDILPTSLHAVELAAIEKGDTVAIWGLGPIGLLAARWAQIKGASKIFGIDWVPERLALARSSLKIDVIDRNQCKDGVPKEILKLCPGGVDAAIEAAGFRHSTTLLHKVERAVGLETDTADILNECIFAVRKWGRISVIADYVGYCNHFPVGHIMLKHLTLRSGQCPCQKYYDYIIEELKKGTIDPTFLVTQDITLEGVPDAYDRLFYKKEGHIKVFIKVSNEGK